MRFFPPHECHKAHVSAPSAMMRHAMKHRPITLRVLLTLFALTPLVGRADAPPPTRTTHFKLRMQSVTTSDPGNTKIESDAQSACAWSVNGAQRTLSYDSLHMAFKVDGKLTTDVTM